MTSEKQKNAGWILPEQLDDHPLLCVKMLIPDNDEYRAAFLGAIDSLQEWWNWEKSYQPGDTRASQAAAYWRTLILDHLCIRYGVHVITNCDDEIKRQLYQIEQQNNEAINARRAAAYTGTPTSINPNAPTTNFNGDNSAQRNDALCSATKDYVYSRVMATLNLYRYNLGLASVAAGIAGWLGGVFGLIGGGVAVLIAALQLIPIEEAAADEDALNDVVCMLYDDLKGVAISPANFTATINALPVDTGNRATIITILKSAAASVENYYLFVDLLGDWYVNRLAGAVDCPCTDSWCYNFDFATAGLEDWSKVATIGAGVLSVGNGISYEDVIDTISNPDVAGRAVYMQRDFTATTITKITATFDVTYGTYDFGGTAEALFINGSAAVSRTRAQSANGTNRTIQWTGAQVASSIRFFCRSSRDQTAPYAYSGNVLLKSVRVEGTGVNPFGSDNC